MLFWVTHSSDSLRQRMVLTTKLVVQHVDDAQLGVQVQAGDTLYTASMVPIMTFLEDSGPGVHDTTAAACSYGLYVLQIGEVSLFWLKAWNPFQPGVLQGGLCLHPKTFGRLPHEAPLRCIHKVLVVSDCVVLTS